MSNQKGISTILVVLIIAILTVGAIGGVYFYFENYGYKSTEYKPQAASETASSQQDSQESNKNNKQDSTQEDLAGWQEIKIDKYGFSMKIPMDYKQIDYMEPEGMSYLLVTSYKKNNVDSFTFSIQDEGIKYVEEAKENMQYQFEQRNHLIGTQFFPESTLVSIQKLEKHNCPIFIYSSEKANKTFNKLVWGFPAYRKESVFSFNFDFLTKNEEEIVSRMINSIECNLRE